MALVDILLLIRLVVRLLAWLVVGETGELRARQLAESVVLLVVVVVVVQLRLVQHAHWLAGHHAWLLAARLASSCGCPLAFLLANILLPIDFLCKYCLCLSALSLETL